jgi:catechol 2,3-dioxygenase-like lactoylglutathione lyase family enzyme
MFMLRDRSVHKIAAYVSDYHTSLSFYRDILGSEVVWESSEDRNAGFRIGTNLLIIQESTQKATGGGFILYFTVPAIENICKDLADNGVTCSDIYESDEFRITEFKDPDGNRLGLFEPVESYIPKVEEWLGRRISL